MKLTAHLGQDLDASYSTQERALTIDFLKDESWEEEAVELSEEETMRLYEFLQEIYVRRELKGAVNVYRNGRV